MTPDTTSSPSRLATLGAGMEQKPQIKVWQPEGFEGLEVEQLEGLKVGFTHKFFMQAHELSLAYNASCLTSYVGGEKHEYYGATRLYMAQHAGEVFYGEVLEEPFNCCTLRLSPELINSLKLDMSIASTNTHFSSMLVSEQLNSLLGDLLDTTFRAFIEPSSQLQRESCLLTLVRAVLYKHADDPPPERHLGKEHRAVSLTKNYIREHLADDVTLPNLSALTGLNKDHLIRVFARDVGITPHVYQTNLRVHKAKKLLAAGTSIAETALLTGFSDQSHLHHTFKKYVMVTPGKYQRACAPQKVLTSG